MGGIYGGVSVQQRASLFGSILAAQEKPRTRSEWQDRFSFWLKPASDTEDAKIETARNKVNRALATNEFLKSRTWAIIPQGSYHNNTNVRTNSDVDLCVCLEDANFYGGPANDTPTREELGHYPLSFTFDDYKDNLATTMKNAFGASVTVGNKAIHIDKDESDKISIDVVPTFTFLSYGAKPMYSSRAAPDIGVALLDSHGNLVTNFPRQHFENGKAKNNATNYRYKYGVRILKRLRNHMKTNGSLLDMNYFIADSAPSFLIECLVYNCPNDLFGHAEIYDDVVAVLRYLSNELEQNSLARMLYTTDGWPSWKEANGIKDLFRPDQKWTRQDADTFVKAALVYMGL